MEMVTSINLIWRKFKAARNYSIIVRIHSSPCFGQNHGRLDLTDTCELLITFSVSLCACRRAANFPNTIHVCVFFFSNQRSPFDSNWCAVLHCIKQAWQTYMRLGLNSKYAKVFSYTKERKSFFTSCTFRFQYQATINTPPMVIIITKLA